jgi:hypothetical protein
MRSARVVIFNYQRRYLSKINPRIGKIIGRVFLHSCLGRDVFISENRFVGLPFANAEHFLRQLPMVDIFFSFHFLFGLAFRMICRSYLRVKFSGRSWGVTNGISWEAVPLARITWEARQGVRKTSSKYWLSITTLSCSPPQNEKIDSR